MLIQNCLPIPTCKNTPKGGRSMAIMIRSRSIQSLSVSIRVAYYTPFPRDSCCCTRDLLHQVHLRNFCGVRADDREGSPRTSVISLEEIVGRRDQCLDVPEQLAVGHLPAEVAPEHLDGVEPGAVGRQV